MNARVGLVCLVAALVGVGASAAPAQEFAVTTRLYNDGPPRKTEGDSKGPPPELVGSSYTLFHAGKVYDHLDRVGEMTILEPAHQRFLIVSRTRMIATTLTFAQIETFIFRGEQQAQQILKDAAAEGKRRDLLGPIEFQLRPVFQQEYKGERRELKLSSPDFAYTVQCHEKIAPEFVEAYLRYADWTARLNYALQGQVLPGPRVAVNAALRERHLLPLQVALAIRSGQKHELRLRAVHRFEWSFTSSDRQKIRFWEDLLKDPLLKHVPFEEFQHAVWSDQATAKR